MPAMTMKKRESGSRGTPEDVLGWREWVALPELGVETIKAKVDTGARTSSLHAFDMVEFVRRGQDMVRFVVHPEQRNSRHALEVELPVHDRRLVRSSSGQAERRPVIKTAIEVLGLRWVAELTLTRRDEMGFRMLLGRQAIRGRFFVDPGKSFLNGKRVKGKRKLMKKKVRKEPTSKKSKG